LQDCYFPKDSVYELCWRLYIERDTYASCGDIRVADPTNILGKGQTYEYFLSQFHSRVAESYFATVTCLPGAFVCITTDVLTAELIRLYSAEPNSLHTAQLLKLGEDRYMTSIFMKLFPRRRAVFIPEAVLFTGVPETSTILKSQRRRWCMSAFHNMFGKICSISSILSISKLLLQSFCSNQANATRQSLSCSAVSLDAHYPGL
jgi:cellulose synthase/poly-beta-1,6-N-acetylglucosamine synthase-like glycosyltransferase